VCGHRFTRHQRVWLDKSQGPPYLIYAFRECRTCECPAYVEWEPVYPKRKPNLGRRLNGKNKSGEDGDREGVGGSPDKRLTYAERETLRHIAGGLSNKEIATAMDVGVHAIENHVKNIYSKLELTGPHGPNRVMAVNRYNARRFDPV